MSVYRTTYELMGPFMDATRPPNSLPEGVAVRLWGVDGRYKGSYRRFPGFISYLNLGRGSPVETTGLTNLSVVTNESVQVGSVVVNTGGGQVLHRYFAKRGTNVEVSTDLPHDGSFNFATDFSVSASGGNGDFDAWSVISYGDRIYIFVVGRAPQFAYSSGGGWVKGDMGVGDHVTGEMLAPTGVITAGTGGFLNFRGEYNVAYKLYSSARDLETGLSKVRTLTMTVRNEGDNELATLGMPVADSDFDTIKIYRTLNLRSPFDTYQGGIFFLEQTASYDGTGIQSYNVGLLHNTELVQQEIYDPYADPVTLPPQSGAAIMYENSVFAAQDPSINGGVGFVWSAPNKVAPESFGSQYQYNGRPEDGLIMNWVAAGDNIFGVTSSVIYKVRKVGAQVSVTRFLNDRGPVGIHAMASFDRDIMILSRQGLIMINGETGASSLFVNLSGFFRDEWTGTLAMVQMAYDSEMGCTFIHDRDQEEMICVWDATRAVTLLKNCPYQAISEGPVISPGIEPASFHGFFESEQKRAYIFSGDEVLFPDARGDGNGTMEGTFEPTLTLQGIANLGSFTGLEDDDATFISVNLVGRRIYVTTGDNQGLYKKILTVDSSTQLTLSGGTMVSDDWPAGAGYSIDPVIFEVELAPVKVGPEKPDPFMRKVVNTIELAVATLAGNVTELGGNLFNVGFYRNGSTTLEALKTIPITTFQPDSCARTEVDGYTLIPSITQISSNTMFELTHVNVRGTITESLDSTE
jgi:hypothetical protein